MTISKEYREPPWKCFSSGNESRVLLVPTMQQSASQLFYCLIDGPVDLNPLRVLKTREAEWASWSVRLHVLGASHAIEFRRDAECVTELLTCLRHATAPAPLLGLQSDVQCSACATIRGLCCRVTLTPFSLLDGDALLASYCDQQRLDVAFPFEGPQTAAVTRIGWHNAGADFVVETVHSYPEEGLGVRSLTMFRDEEAEP